MINGIIVLTEEEQHRLLQVAANTIQYGVLHGHAPQLQVEDFAAALQAPRAVFITLTAHDTLRGCVGTLESGLPLVINVAKYAYAAAFNDSRFAALTSAELSELHIHISILSPLEPLPCSSEEDLLRQLQPGVDGLLLEEGPYRATLLPSVWDSLPEPKVFIRHLKMKAGLPAHYWSGTLQVQRYTAQSISGDWQVAHQSKGAT